MFVKPAHRRLFKGCLLTTNIVLGVTFACLIIFALTVVRPNIIAKATDNEQYYLLDLNHLPQGLDTIEPDYVGKESNLVNQDSNPSPKDEINTTNVAGNDLPKIAIIVTNLGLNKRINELALKLPAQIAFGVLHYSTNVQAFLNNTQITGHEIYISLPKFDTNCGENYEVDISLSEEEKLNNFINLSERYNGFYSNLKGIFHNSKSLQNLLSQLESKKLALILKQFDDPSKNLEFLKDKNIIQADIIIDPDADAKEIEDNLDQLIKVAKTSKKAIGYANGYLLTIEMIHKWLSTLEAQGVKLVSVNAILERSRQ